MKKRQVVVIHGGDVHNSYQEYLAELKRERADREDFLPRDAGEKRWKDKLPARLGRAYEIFAPEMPNAWSAKYAEWKIWFDKMMKFVRPGAVFVGHSLGGIFLARYFAENADHGARSVFLLAAPYRDSSTKPKDRLADFVLPRDISRLEKLGKRLYLYHSTDDPVVSFADFKVYEKHLPEAQTRMFKDRGHFRLKRFREIEKDIKKAFE